MKYFKFISTLLVLTVAVSCSDTEVVKRDEQIVENDEPIIVNQFRQRVLIEDYTGTWCGFCTRVTQGIDNVQLETDHAVIVAVHNGNDPYHFVGVEPLRALILPDTPLFPLPTARLNRTIVWQWPESDNVQQVIDLTGANCGLGLAMTSTVSGGNINLDVKIKFAQDYGNLKLVVYALEDRLIYNQTNYTSTYYGGVTPILSYEHNHVLRAALTNILGDALAGDTTTGSTVVKNFSISVPSNVANTANLSFVAFVVDANNKAINVRSAYANDSQEFEENE